VFAHPYWNLIYGCSINFFEDKKHKESENWWLPKVFLLFIVIAILNCCSNAKSRSCYFFAFLGNTFTINLPLEE
jgi:hypothetical protein